jgi:hypothetical protein
MTNLSSIQDLSNCFLVVSSWLSLLFVYIEIIHLENTFVIAQKWKVIKLLNSFVISNESTINMLPHGCLLCHPFAYHLLMWKLHHISHRSFAKLKISFGGVYYLWTLCFQWSINIFFHDLLLWLFKLSKFDMNFHYLRPNY